MTNTVTFFSSIGPTSDGRIKPDVVAPGHNLVGARSSQKEESEDEIVQADDQLFSARGTSMSAPVVAGLASMIRQFLEEEIGMDFIKGSTIKGMIIASAHSKCFNLIHFLLFHHNTIID